MVDAGHISIGLAIGTALCSMLSGVAVGAWVVSGKNKDLQAHGKAIKDIHARCAAQKEAILHELKSAICDAMKVALKDLKLEYRERQANTESALAVVTERVSQAERDIDNIFSRLRDLEGVRPAREK